MFSVSSATLLYSLPLTLALFLFSPVPGLLTQVTAHSRPSTAVLPFLSAAQRRWVPIRSLTLNDSKREILGKELERMERRGKNDFKENKR